MQTGGRTPLTGQRDPDRQKAGPSESVTEEN